MKWSHGDRVTIESFRFRLTRESLNFIVFFPAGRRPFFKNIIIFQTKPEQLVRHFALAEHFKILVAYGPAFNYAITVIGAYDLSLAAILTFKAERNRVWMYIFQCHCRVFLLFLNEICSKI